MRDSEDIKVSTNRILEELAVKYNCCSINIKRILKENGIYKL